MVIAGTWTLIGSSLGSALLGTIIGGAVTYWTERKIIKYEDKRKKEQRFADLYTELEWNREAVEDIIEVSNTPPDKRRKPGYPPFRKRFRTMTYQQLRKEGYLIDLPSSCRETIFSIYDVIYFYYEENGELDPKAFEEMKRLFNKYIAELKSELLPNHQRE